MGIDNIGGSSPHNGPIDPKIEADTQAYKGLDELDHILRPGSTIKNKGKGLYIAIRHLAYAWTLDPNAIPKAERDRISKIMIFLASIGCITTSFTPGDIDQNRDTIESIANNKTQMKDLRIAGNFK